MVRRNIQKIINQYSNELVRLGIHPEQVLIYGSQTKGTARPDSDIDLIVISKDWKKHNELERLEILGLAAARILEPVQAKGFTPKEIELNQLSPFWAFIFREVASPIA